MRSSSSWKEPLTIANLHLGRRVAFCKVLDRSDDGLGHGDSTALMPEDVLKTRFYFVDLKVDLYVLQRSWDSRLRKV